MTDKRERTYIAIDLKSFYASVECVERELDPLTTNLVVADKSRTEKTICLAVSPSLKAYGISGRSRLFEVIQKVKEVNRIRKAKAPGKMFSDKSYDANLLENDPCLELDYIVARPRMSLYMEYSRRIYQIYLEFVSPQDIHVYSVDEVFIDITNYLTFYGISAYDLALKIVSKVYSETGITATCGIGTNLYLCKIAMDIVAKHVEPNKDGVRIAQLDEMSYRKSLWNHRPITDFWRVGKGYSKRLAKYGIFTMGDVARCSVENEDLLYKLFGVNAELLIDHAWGYEPCTIDMIKAYRPSVNSFSSGQVLQTAYSFKAGRIVIEEMAEAVALDLVEKAMVTDQMILTVGYDIESLLDPEIKKNYNGEITIDNYGREVPKHAHGTKNLYKKTSSTKIITDAILELYDRLVDPNLLIRRLTITTNNVVRESDIVDEPKENYEQMDLFTDYSKIEEEEKNRDAFLEKERKMQEMMLEVKKKFGKNAILKGISLEEDATARERNAQIGGHKA